MITVEDLLMAYASAYDAWLDPEAERKNPTPEYAELIRQAVSFENAKLREERDYYKAMWEHATVTDCELRRVRAAWKEDREKNAKLRELVLDLYDAIDSVFWDGEWETKERFKPRMRELGVEVES